APAPPRSAPLRPGIGGRGAHPDRGSPVLPTVFRGQRRPKNIKNISPVFPGRVTGAFSERASAARSPLPESDLPDSPGTAVDLVVKLAPLNPAPFPRIRPAATIGAAAPEPDEPGPPLSPDLT